MLLCYFVRCGSTIRDCQDDKGSLNHLYKEEIQVSDTSMLAVLSFPSSVAVTLLYCVCFLSLAVLCLPYRVGFKHLLQSPRCYLGAVNDEMSAFLLL